MVVGVEEGTVSLNENGSLLSVTESCSQRLADTHGKGIHPRLKTRAAVNQTLAAGRLVRPHPPPPRRHGECLLTTQPANNS